MPNAPTAPQQPSGADSTGTVLVTGARGKTGRRITERLTGAGHAVRAVGRESSPRFSWDEPAPEAADGIAGLFTELFDGRNVHPTGGVRAALDREPRSFAAAMRRAHNAMPGAQ